MNNIEVVALPAVAMTAAVIVQIVPDGTSLDGILNQFLDLGLVGAIAVMFYTFWRTASNQTKDIQEERIEELLRQRDAALEERDLWYAENMKQYQERLKIYEEFVSSHSVVVSAEQIINEDDLRPIREE